MNVLSLTGILPIPGVLKTNDFLIPLYKEYKKIDKQNDVFFIRPVKFYPFSSEKNKYKNLKEYQINNFNVTIIRYLSSWRYPSIHSIVASYSAYYLNRKKLISFIKSNAIDIIHAEYFFPDGYLAYLLSKKCNIPFILTTHHEFRYFDSFFSKRLAVKILCKAAYITPLNYASYDLYKKHTTVEIVVVPHGIDRRFLDTVPNSDKNEKVKVLTIAALFRYKNIDKVLMALSGIKKNSNFKYTIVGIGPQEKALKTLTDHLGLKERVDFVPRIDYNQIHEFIGSFDIFILPSYFESFGRVLFEAMAVGLPVICAKNSGIHGYFKEGEEGFSVDRNNLQELEEKISILLENDLLRREMGAKAKLLINKFTWDKIATTFHNLYLNATEKYKDV